MKKPLVAMVYFLSFYYACNAFALWQGPVEVVTGLWGTSVGQFGFVNADPTDGFPTRFLIDSDGNILISDSFNKRVQVFKTNGNITTFSYKDLNPGWKIKQWPSNKIGIYDNIFVEGGYIERQFYDYHGNLLREFSIPDCILKKVNDDGSLILQNYKTEVYYKYSPTGQLLETYKEKPLELGVVKRDRAAGKYKYKSIVKYHDHTYEILSNQPFKKYCRDLMKNLYRIETFAERAENETIISYRLYKYGFCDNEENIFNMPKSKYEPRPPKADKYPTWTPVPIIEYGEPIVSPSGDIYCWARTKTEYKILKWTWQGEPDAPQSLKANSGKESLVLTWKKPVEEATTAIGYEIYRSSDVCGPFTKIKKVKKDVLQYTDKKVKEGETYYYQVCAERGSGYSGYSNKAVGSIKD